MIGAKWVCSGRQDVMDSKMSGHSLTFLRLLLQNQPGESCQGLRSAASRPGHAGRLVRDWVFTSRQPPRVISGRARQLTAAFNCWGAVTAQCQSCRTNGVQSRHSASPAGRMACSHDTVPVLQDEWRAVTSQCQSCRTDQSHLTL